MKISYADLKPIVKMLRSSEPKSYGNVTVVDEVVNVSSSEFQNGWKNSSNAVVIRGYRVNGKSVDVCTAAEEIFKNL